MTKTTEEKKIIEQKLKKLKIDIDNLPEIFYIKNKVKYKPQKEYDNTNKVYQFINVDDIDIYITTGTRLDEPEKKYKNARPLVDYLKSDDEDSIENYNQFLKLVNRLDMELLNNLEEEQKAFKKSIPYEVKYKDNFIWNIYYSETENRYFMMFSIEEERVESLFYLIEKKIKNIKRKNKEKIYVPVSGKDFSYSFLKKTEISDLENYLWFFTNEWANIYEVYDEDENKTFQILGEVPVFEKIKSTYKIEFEDKESAQKQYKLIKALFILQSNMEEEYDFKVALNEKGTLSFYYNHNEINYDNLPEFIKNEIERKRQRINKQICDNIVEKERWILLKETIEKKNLDYMYKEKQIVTFLECKKTFFGKISYFFKKKKRKLEPVKDENKVEEKIEKVDKFEIEKKENYTIEDLLKIGEVLIEKEKEYKNLKMDIKALENKKENLESKIKNATLYINEIESHKKSIFDFWKFTNKDEVNMLVEGNELIKETEHVQLKKIFSFEDDIEEFAQKVDEKQRMIFNEKETDAIYAIYQDINSFSILNKNRVLKKDEKEIEKNLNKLKEEYVENYEQIKEKDFDIFGSVVEDKTKIKTLKNNKHREIEKDKYKILNIKNETTLEEYKDIILNYKKILDEAETRMTAKIDIPVYKISENTIEDEKYIIMDMNSEKEVNKITENDERIIFNKINIKEGMPVTFYSNIMFYNNRNKTLPLGMDISTEVLLNLERFELKLISRKNFNVNLQYNDNNIIKNVEVYEYDIVLKEEK